MSLLVEPIALRPRPPAPDDRWRPTRAGLVNLWRYWDETFTFHDGRLLLRGPNGSGKSMALELLLPFLLDGDASPSKLTSAARSRGGLYERVMTGTVDTTRTGFAWVELRRGDATFTVGARLRASASTKTVTRTLFSTTQTVGDDLHLLDEARVPLSRSALVEAVGEHGRVTDAAAEHRDAVRAVLFPGFSADRYDALVNALLALRKEKLSQHLDLDKLSEVMSEALPTIDEHELAAVAEGFERLDRRRDGIALLERDVAEVDELAKRQRAYARAVIASMADEVRRAESARDGIVRRERLAADERDQVAADLEAAQAEGRDHRERGQAVTGELEGIRTSALYQEGAQLAQLQHDLGLRTDERDELDADRDRRRQDADDASTTVDQAEAGEADAAGNLERAARELRGVAEEAGAGAVLDEVLATDDPDRGTALLGAWVRERHAAIGEIRALLDEHRRAVDRRTDADAILDERRRRVDELTAERTRAAAALYDRRTEFVAAVRAWADQSASFTDGWRTLFLGAILDANAVESVDAVDAAVAFVRAEHATELALARADLAARRQEVEAEQEALEAELAPLVAGGWPELVAPPWRSARDDARPGAPLCRLVDVVAGTGDDVVDGLEAALVAAGLADAWVTPDGGVAWSDAGQAERAADLWLTVLDDDRRSSTTLADHLVPWSSSAELGVAPEVVAGVLASVATAATAPASTANRKVVVGLDGTFRLGSAGGRGSVRPATLLGAAARERHRQAEIERLRGVIDECERRRRALDADAQRLDTTSAAVTADLDACPPRQPCDEAAAALGHAEVRLGEADSARLVAEAACRAAEDLVRTAQRSLATRAAAVNAPTEAAGLDRLAEAVDDVREAGAVWRRRADERATAARALTLARDGHARARQAADDTERRFQAVADGVAVLSAKVDAVRAALGAGYDELLARVAELETEAQSLERRRDELHQREVDLAGRLGTVEEALRSATAALADAETARTDIHRRFADLHASPLPADARLEPAAEPLDGVTAVLTRARAVATELDGVNAESDERDRLSRLVEGRLHDAKASLGIRVDLERVAAPGGWLAIRGSTGGVHLGLVELQASLRQQLTAAQAELQAEEAALFERTLSGSIRQALADRIRGANELVAAINRQLTAVQTKAGGVSVRLRWDVDDDQPDAVRSARSLLLRDPADLSDTEREALTEFVRARVDQARAELEAHAPWEARLRESLDYRAWHRFSLQLAHRDWEGFKPATARLLQRLSTGERSVALHLPMIASLAAHYTGPNGEPGDGPRLILLDELFAGVDTANRAQLFGTFTTWDLDAVFTSDHEWCQYASLDGIAIHHLQGGADDEPVTSTRFTWDGHERRIDDGGTG